MKTDQTDPVNPRRLRIAVLNRVFSPQGGGAERYSIALVEQLASRHEMHVFAQDIASSFIEQWPHVSFHRVSAPLRKSRWLNQLWYATATWWATRAGFDVVHSHENTWHGQVQTVHVLPIRYNLFHGLSAGRKALRWLSVLTSPRLLAYLGLERARFAEQPNRHVVLTSPSLLAIFKATYPACSHALSVITPGVAKVDVGFDKAAAQQALGLPVQGWTIAFVGNDYEKKGLPTLLNALKSLPKYVNLAVVGNQAQIPVFQKLANQFGLAQRVHFLGAIADVSQVYQAADALAHPTREDTFAMVVLEAMSYGLPVVVSQARYCGIAGMLTDGQNALILDDPKDAPAVAVLLRSILDDADLRARLSRQAREFADGFAWEEIARQQEAMYLEIAGESHFIG
ncbi:MAG: glycosyltransferase family 4 protein [Burkholderiaceae bacterium]|nr:glycosyltransferase family 4 protein [Burkholderiaceae bacterium]